MRDEDCGTKIIERCSEEMEAANLDTNLNDLLQKVKSQNPVNPTDMINTPPSNIPTVPTTQKKLKKSLL